MITNTASSAQLQLQIFDVFRRSGILVTPGFQGVFSIASSETSIEKIKQIFQSNFPFFIPRFFLNEKESKFCFTLEESDHDPIVFSPELIRLKQYLKEYEFCDRNPDTPLRDPFKTMNCIRKLVDLMLDEALQRAVSSVWKGGVLIEVGSGIGYLWSDEQEASLLRIQPDLESCRCLAAEGSVVHQIDIQRLCTLLAKRGEKIPLFVLLNVFDTMNLSMQKESLRYFSECQDEEGCLLFLLDTNPELNQLTATLKNKYPQHAIYPYTVGGPFDPLQAIVIPQECAPYFAEDSTDLVTLFTEEIEFFQSNPYSKRSKLQETLAQYTAEETAKFQILSVEELFLEETSNRCKENGYDIERIEYSLCYGLLDRQDSKIGKGNLLYRPVTSKCMSVIHSDVKDPNLHKIFEMKGITDVDFLTQAKQEELLKEGKKIGCAEVLVIVARKQRGKQPAQIFVRRNIDHCRILRAD
jgi:hypothetical protein